MEYMAEPRKSLPFILLLVMAVSISSCAPKNREAKELRESCRAGDAKACATYAVRLEHGDHTLRDPVAAMDAYQHACTGGIGDACASLGSMYFEGDEQAQRSRDPVKALKLFREGCDHGGMNGCTQL